MLQYCNSVGIAAEGAIKGGPTLAHKSFEVEQYLVKGDVYITKSKRQGAFT